MIFYRISKCKYINDLSGTGARLYGGRWNSVGHPMVYLASSRSLAVLEVLVHLPPTLLPSNFCLGEVEVPVQAAFEVAIDVLPDGWRNSSAPQMLQRLGDLFLDRKEFLLMKVPSAIIPQEFNYLLNPLHPDATLVKVAQSGSFSFDERLVSL